MNLGSQILAARQALGISQDELAARLGTTQARVSSWETGGRAPRLENLPGLAVALGVALSWELDGAQVTVDGRPAEARGAAVHPFAIEHTRACLAGDGDVPCDCGE